MSAFETRADIKPTTDELMGGVRVVLLHLFTHMELLAPSFRISSFRKTLFQIEKDVLADMSVAERERWISIIGQFLPERPDAISRATDIKPPSRSHRGPLCAPPYLVDERNSL